MRRALMVVLVVAVGLVGLAASASSTLVEDFEDGDGSAWTSGNGAMSAVMAPVNPRGGSYVGSPSFTGSCYGPAMPVVEIRPDWVGWMFRADADATHGNGVAVRLAGVGGTIELISYYDGQLRHHVPDLGYPGAIEGTRRVPFMEAELARWYAIELRNIDWQANTLDIWVDGTLQVAGVPFTDDGVTGGLILVQAYSCPTAGTMYVDDIAHGFDAPSFSDVSETHPFSIEIEWMARNGISTGYPDGTFRPGADVTRQAMSAFMYRLAGEPAFSPPAVATFSDVPASHPFFSEIEWLAASGISTGYPDGTFRPGAEVTRMAMSAFMYRLAGEPAFVPPGTPSFADVSMSHPFYLAIEWMADAGVSTGYVDGSFRPAADVTRQAMSAFMHRLHPLLD